MKISKLLINLVLIVLLLLTYSISKTIYYHEDFIGTYYLDKIPNDYAIEINGSSAGLLDSKTGEYLVNSIDSFCVENNFIYGMTKNKYFLVDTKTRKVFFDGQPTIKQQMLKMQSPLEFHNAQSRKIDIIDFVFLFLLICYILGATNILKKMRFNTLNKLE
jgi:hypothetical protein